MENNNSPNTLGNFEQIEAVESENECEDKLCY